MKIPEDVAEMLEKETSIKMIGTVDTNLNVNLEHIKVVKITSNDTILIPHFTGNDRTFENLQKNKKISIGIFEPGIIGFKLNGFFTGIKKSEEYLKYFSRFFDKEKLDGAISIRITEIYALTMAIAGEKIA
ncbi:MAG: hypothetical protein J7K32_04400 [Deltaproteobacteria bacterium]|nr:hypothetical protein [Deltaproteobacteria bacterium]